MMNWIIYSLPWQVKLGFWVVVASAVALVILRLFGVKWGLIFGGIAGVVIGAATIFNKGQQVGYKTRTGQEKEAVDAQQQEWNKIDAGPLTPGAAYDKLRNRTPPSGK
jgi:hypothetical protein